MLNSSVTYILNVEPDSFAGRASVNRVLSFEKALKINGISCSTLFPYSKTKYLGPVSKILAFVKILSALIRAKKGDIFILYGLSNFVSLLLMFKDKIVILVEVTEYPYSMVNPKYEESKTQEDKVLSKLYDIDGFITCSEALKVFYSSYLNGVPVLVIPVIVDFSLFDKRNLTNSSDCQYVGYCGSLDNNKDGVPILMESFAIVARDFLDLKLIIVGPGSTQSENELRNLAKRLGLERRIIFRGGIDHKEIPNFLANADILALARPLSKQAEGGFPSKIGEYLAVGGIVVATKVGEIPLYLKDGYNAFMAEPDSIESFAVKMKEALESPHRQKISRLALRTSKTFDIKHQGYTLIQFIKAIR